MSNISIEKKRWLTSELDKLAVAGLSRAEVARRMGLSPQALNNVLNRNNSVSDSFLDRFIKAFGLNQLDLSAFMDAAEPDEIQRLKAEIEELKKQNSALLDIVKNLSAK